MLLNRSERDPLLAPKPRFNAAGSEELLKPPPLPLGPTEISRSQRWGILAGVWSATFLSAVNSTLVPTMLPSISSEFKKFNQASWLGTSYLLATCTFTPLYGRLSDVLGRKGANHLALFFAAAGVLGCGLSTTMEMLILSRFISGIGGGGLFTTSSVIVSDMYSIRQRGLTQGIASVFNSTGMALGGPFGGFITDRFGWRWAFLIQMPLFLASFLTTSHNLHYVTPGKGKSASEILRRIDWGGSFTLLTSVGSMLLFLSARYNEGLPWTNTTVIVSLCAAIIGAISFLTCELFVAREPVLAPFLLKKKIPVLVGMSNFLVALCNFTIIYFFPMWFQTVMLTSASTAGLHLVPNSVGLSLGSIFAGYMMHKTGKYKMINLTFGWLPFIGATMIASLRTDSPPLLTWISNAPLGFGNAVVLQTMLIALLVRLPPSQIAVGTGFSALFRGIGQVGGVAVSSAIFQSRLDTELRERIVGPGADELIMKIRRSSQLVATLPADLQAVARQSYAISLHSVFVLAACSTLLAFIVRLPIPDKNLEDQKEDVPSSNTLTAAGEVAEQSVSEVTTLAGESSEEDEDEDTVNSLDLERNSDRSPPR